MHWSAQAVAASVFQLPFYHGSENSTITSAASENGTGHWTCAMHAKARYHRDKRCVACAVCVPDLALVPCGCRVLCLACYPGCLEPESDTEPHPLIGTACPVCDAYVRRVFQFEPPVSKRPPSSDCDSQGGASIPIIEVAFKDGMWWSIPPEMSAAIFEKFDAGQDAAYTWDWGESRQGAWRPEGEQTSINRYTIDFARRRQTNIDNGRMRTIRVIWIVARDAMPQWTGQIQR